MIVSVEGFGQTLVLDGRIDENRERFETCLELRHSDRNCFWIRRIDEAYPCLAVAFSGRYATVNFFDVRQVGGCDWVSESDVADLPRGGETIFCFSSEWEEQSMDNGVVISAADAVLAAMEFVRNPLERPKCISWLEL